jgi:CubicO group peptidase (beta-lactamase class C family)
VNIASMSKAFTAAAVALLIDDFAHGRNVTPLPGGVAELSWKTKVKDVLPKLRLYDLCASEHVTIQDMLSHLTGLPRSVWLSQDVALC